MVNDTNPSASTSAHATALCFARKITKFPHTRQNHWRRRLRNVCPGQLMTLLARQYNAHSCCCVCNACLCYVMQTVMHKYARRVLILFGQYQIGQLCVRTQSIHHTITYSVTHSHYHSASVLIIYAHHATREHAFFFTHIQFATCFVRCSGYTCRRPSAGRLQVSSRSVGVCFV